MASQTQAAPAVAEISAGIENSLQSLEGMMSLPIWVAGVIAVALVVGAIFWLRDID